MRGRKVRAQEVADEAVRYTKTGRLSARATDVALVAIVVWDEAASLAEYRSRIRTEYRRLNPECGSVFLLFVLPIIANLISHWILKWISKRNAGEIRRLKSEASSSLGSS